MERVLLFIRVGLLLLLSALHAITLSRDGIPDNTPADISQTQQDHDRLTEIMQDEIPLSDGSVIIIEDETIPLSESIPREVEYVKRLVELTNAERIKAGLNALEVSELLQTAAAKRAEEIEELYEHKRPDGRAWSTISGDFDIQCKGLGENLNKNTSTPESTVRSWMNSTAHKENILLPAWNKVGAGVHIGADGTIYWAMVYTD